MGEAKRRREHGLPSRGHQPNIEPFIRYDATKPPIDPGGETKAAIAEAVHEAVYASIGKREFGYCHLYTLTGGLVAHAVTGHDYVRQYGAVRVRTGVIDAEGPLDYGMDPAASGYNGQEFHGWLVRQPTDLPRDGWQSRPVREDDEVIDLTLRYIESASRQIGVGWNRDPLPPFFWGRYGDLMALGVYPAADRRLMEMLINDRHDRTSPSRLSATPCGC